MVVAKSCYKNKILKFTNLREISAFSEDRALFLKRHKWHKTLIGDIIIYVHSTCHRIIITKYLYDFMSRSYKLKVCLKLINFLAN